MFSSTKVIGRKIFNSRTLHTLEHTLEEKKPSFKVTDLRGRPRPASRPLVLQPERPKTLEELKQSLDAARLDMNEAQQMEMFAQTPESKAAARQRSKSKQDYFDQMKKDYDQAHRDKLTMDSNENYRYSNELQAESNELRAQDVRTREGYIKVAQWRNRIMGAGLAASAAYVAKYAVENEDKAREEAVSHAYLKAQLETQIEKLQVDMEKLEYAKRGGVMGRLYRKEAIQNFENSIKMDKKAIHETKNKIAEAIAKLGSYIERNEQNILCRVVRTVYGQSSEKLIEQHNELVDLYEKALTGLGVAIDRTKLAARGIKKREIEVELESDATPSVEPSNSATPAPGMGMGS